MTSKPNKNRAYGLNLKVVERGKRPTRRNRHVEIAEVGKQIIFDLSILDTYRYDGWEPIHYDLLLVCASVAYADRRCARRPTNSFRPFKLNIPVSDLVTWQRPNVQSSLKNTLRHLTGDDWEFSFTQSSTPTDEEGSQRSLPFTRKKEFVIAYSDGLDSRCVSGLFDEDDSALRVRISKTNDQIKCGDKPFDLIPFKIKQKDQPESGYRSRGFIFASITAIASHLSDTNRIIVPESGQGALGPVLLPLHNIYADYRCHPTFFRKMEEFIKVLLNASVSYEQPRLWNTKGETVGAFLAKGDQNQDSIINTRSCWQQRHNVRINGKLRQCGLCAACLLRRMSIHAAGIKEPTETYTFEDLTPATFQESFPSTEGAQPTMTMIEYGSVGARHLHQLATMSTQPKQYLRPHIFEIARATNSSEEKTSINLDNLLTQHSDEWHDFILTQGQNSFISRWTTGGRYA